MNMKVEGDVSDRDALADLLRDMAEAIERGETVYSSELDLTSGYEYPASVSVGVEVRATQQLSESMRDVFASTRDTSP